MTQIIGNVMVIELTPEDKMKDLTQQIFDRYVLQVQENAVLRLELERIRSQHRLIQLAHQG